MELVAPAVCGGREVALAGAVRRLGLPRISPSGRSQVYDPLRPGTGASRSAEVFRGMAEDVLAAVTLPGAIAVVLIIAAAVINARDVRRRDPVRRFTRQQRRAGMARAGGVREMGTGFGRRCSRAAEHGDHFYPWSKGGSTSLQNFVAACSRCNRAKGARIPSPGQQLRLERRRRSMSRVRLQLIWLSRSIPVRSPGSTVSRSIGEPVRWDVSGKRVTDSDASNRTPGLSALDGAILHGFRPRLSTRLELLPPGLRYLLDEVLVVPRTICCSNRQCLPPRFPLELLSSGVRHPHPNLPGPRSRIAIQCRASRSLTLIIHGHT